MADELGSIHGENVQEFKNSLLKEIKGSIRKNRKIGGLSLGQTVDLGKLNEFNSKINRLGRLAENSRVIDKLYKSYAEGIGKNKYVIDKGGVNSQVLRILSDQDKLESMNVEDLSREIEGLIKANSDSLSVINDLMGDVGTQQFTDDQGNSYTLPNVFELNESGQPSLSVDGTRKLAQAIGKANMAGFSVDPNEVLPRFVNQFDTSVKQAKAEDPRDIEYKELRNQSLRDKASKLRKGEQDEELQKEALNTIARAISLPRTMGTSAIKDKAFDLLQTKGFKITESEDGKTLNIKKEGKPDFFNERFAAAMQSSGGFDDQSSATNFNINLRKDEGALQFFLNNIFNKKDMKFLGDSQYIDELGRLLSTEGREIQSLADTEDPQPSTTKASSSTLGFFKK